MHKLLLALLLAGALLAAAEPKLAGWEDKDNAKTKSKDIEALLANEAANEGALRGEFSKWQAHYKKTGGNFGQFKKGLKRIAAINADPKRSYWAAPNKYTDLTWDEFRAVALGSERATPGNLQSGGRRLRSAAASSAAARRLLQSASPAAKDWTALNGVTPVKDQGGCGSCWAFATIAGIEARVKIQTGQELNLSEQELVDCVKSSTGYDTGYWSNGCSGGWPTNAMDFASRWNVTTEALYPYTSVDGTCLRNVLASTTAANTVQTSRVNNAGYVAVPRGSASALIDAVARGPVVSTIFVDNDFAYYGGGIYDSTTCPTGSVNHAVLIVGYDKTAGIGAAGSYWKIKNSWDTWWGEAGYIRVAMKADGPGLCAMYYNNWEVTAIQSAPAPTPAPAICKVNADCAPAGQDGGCWTCNTGANTCTQSANGATSSTGGYCMNGSSKQCLAVSNCKIPAGQSATCWQCTNYTCSQKTNGSSCGTGKTCSAGACVAKAPCNNRKKCPCYPYVC